MVFIILLSHQGGCSANNPILKVLPVVLVTGTANLKKLVIKTNPTS